MKTRRLFWTALALAVLAVGMQLSAMQRNDRALYIRVRAIKAGVAAAPSAVAEIAHERRVGSVLSTVGLISCVGSIGAIWRSAQRCEPSWRGIPVALLIFYGMLWFTLT